MFNSFSYFLYNNDINDYLNCYSTFMMSNKYLKDNVLNHRMNFLINYYIYQNKSTINKNKLMEYYLRSYKDNYLVNKNIIHFNSVNDEPEKRDDDVEDHYKYMFINPPPKEPIDYDELDKQYALKLEIEEEEKNRQNDYKEYSDEDDYDYDEYNSYDFDEFEIDYEYYDDEY